MLINLRGHHLLCIQGYQGYGYSEKFTDNMDNIIEVLTKPFTKILLCDSFDDICKKCPNLTEDKICKSIACNNQIITMDKNVLMKINYSDEEILAEELFKKVNESFKSKEDIDIVCNNCSWLNKCLFYQKFI